MTSKVLLTTWIGVVLDADKKSSKYKVPSPFDYIGLESPKGSITGVYGRRSRTVFANVVNGILRSEGKFAVSVSFEVDRDIDANTKIDTSGKFDYSNLKTLNMLRLTKEAEAVINNAWLRILGGNVPLEESLFPSMATFRPDLIASLREMEQFKHIDLFIYPVHTPAGIIPFASCFEPSACSNFEAAHNLKGSLIPPV